MSAAHGGGRPSAGLPGPQPSTAETGTQPAGDATGSPSVTGETGTQPSVAKTGTQPAGEVPVGELRCPEPHERPDLWPSTLRREADGSLSIGGRRVEDILAQAPTPVFVLDEADLRGKAATWSAAMAEEFWPGYGMNDGRAFYAGKAFLTRGIAQMVVEEGMGIDTASRVELIVGLAGWSYAGRDHDHADGLGLHGNGKTVADLTAAISHRVGHIVLDSREEVDYARQAVAAARAKGALAPEETAGVMVRVTTGIHAGGHEYISTAHEDQKFGLSLATGEARAAIDAIIAAPELSFHGLHSHIGSQILSMDGFEQAARAILQLRHEVAQDHGVLCPEVDLGGGYGIAYTGQDPVAPSPATVARVLAQTVRDVCTELGDAIPTVSIEPGRSVIGPAMVTLYTVTGCKDVQLEGGAVRRYVSVDGGMSDNIRPALYGADYTATLANRVSDPAVGLVRCRVVGTHCESGDVVVRNVDLPADVQPGDVLAVPATGAYGRSMASNYNLFTRPGVAWVRDGQQGWILRPETLHDILALEGP